MAIRIINEKLKKASEYNPNSEKSFNEFIIDFLSEDESGVSQDKIY